MLRAGWLAAALVLAAPVHASAAGLDLRGWLERPGVRLLAVDVFATWCAPCVKALPDWKRIHEKHRDAGVRVVVVITQDPEGCARLDWAPDEVVCDPDGTIAGALGAGRALPASFLWSWQGRSLARGDAGVVEAAIEKWLAAAPRVALEIDVEPGAGVDAAGLAGLVRAKLSEIDKLVLVASEEERAALDRLKARSLEARYDEKLQCAIGAEVPANSLLRARLGAVSGRPKLSLSLFSAESGCLLGSSIVEWARGKDAVSVAEGVSRLLQRLTVEIEMRGAAPVAAPVAAPRVADCTSERACAGACDAGAFPACTKLGGMILAKKRDPLRALAVLGRACDGGDAAGCGKLGALYLAGTGVARDVGRAKELGKRGCDGGAPEGCLVLAMVEDSAPLFARACDAGLQAGCARLARAHQLGRGVAADAVRAALLGKAACDAGELLGCTVLGTLHAEGRGVAKDPRAAAKLLGAACAKGEGEACRVLGAIEKGAGRGAAAKKRFDQGCAAGSAESCRAAAMELEGYARTGALEALCNAADLEACRALAGEYRNEDAQKNHAMRVCKMGAGWACEQEAWFAIGKGLTPAYTPDPPLAADRAARACAADPATCATLGMVAEHAYGMPRDHARAAEAYGKRCAQGRTGACVHRARLQARGLGMAADPAAAIAVLTPLCERGGWEASEPCAVLAELHLDGVGFPKDVARGLALAQKMCEAYNARACTRVGDALATGQGVARDDVKALATYAKVCPGTGLEALDACLGYARMLFEGRGRGGAYDGMFIHRGEGIFKMVCERADARGCLGQARVFEEGAEGLPKDPARARALYARACELGAEEACARR